MVLGFTLPPLNQTHTKAALVSSVLISLCRSPIAPQACVTLHIGDGERDTLSSRQSGQKSVSIAWLCSEGMT